MTVAPSQTQEARILKLLQENWPAWTSALDLCKVSVQYGARVYSLRRRGIAISNRVERRADGTKLGMFRLGPKPTPRSAELRKQQAKEPLSAQQIELLNMGNMPREYPD